MPRKLKFRGRYIETKWNQVDEETRLGKKPQAKTQGRKNFTALKEFQ